MAQRTSDTPAARAAFRYPAFRSYMAARSLVVASSEMQAIAVAWQIYSITHRPLDLGLVGLAQFLPGILLFLVTGHTADRAPRKRILATCYAGFAICSLSLLALSLSGLRSVYPIYAVLLMNGVVRAFHGPASQAFLPLLVDERHFANAVAWGSSMFQACTIVGPMLGGILYAAAGSPNPVYLTGAAACSAAFLLMTTVQVRAVARDRRAASLEMLLEGLRFLWRSEVMLGTISLDLFAVLLGGAVALLPVYAREILNVGATGLGALRSAPGVGAVILAVIVAHWPIRRHAGAAMLWCVCAFGALTIVFGLSRSFPLSLLALALLGASDMVSVIVRHTLIQLGTPDEMRGRVSAVNMVFIGASNEVGQFESGLTAHWFGTVPAVVLGGIGTILVVGLWAVFFPQLRRVDRLSR